MPDPMRIRAQLTDGVTTVRVLMSHEMETGLRKDAQGMIVPAWFIQQVSAQLNGRTVLTAQWGPSVAKNPYLQFRIKGGAPGDTVAISWIDNRDETRTDSAVIS
jgi:sulfur-oxidizing protein SoxZ